MEFRKLSEKDEPLVFSLLCEAADWLKSKNIDYWQNWHNPPEAHYNWIIDGISNGQFYAVYLQKTLAGMLRIQFEDEGFWGEKNDKCVYIHSFTVKRSLCGQNLGYRILGKIEKDYKKKGFRFMRLDCGIHLERLIQYYREYGFRKVKNGNVGGYPLVFLEKEIINGLPTKLCLKINPVLKPP